MDLEWSNYIVDIALKDLSAKVDMSQYKDFIADVKQSVIIALAKERKLTKELNPASVTVYKALHALENKAIKHAELAEICNLNRKTVALAVQELQASGYLEYAQGSGIVKRYKLLH